MSDQKKMTKKQVKEHVKKKTKTAQADETLEKLAQEIENFDPTATNHYKDYPLSKETKEGLKFAKFEQPTPIQRLSIHKALQGRDILGAAKTGSGKTLAFVIPVLENLYRQRWSYRDGLGALIISPTRELATQTYEVLRKVGKLHGVRFALIIGGTNAKDVRREQDLIQTSNIIICTPGRILDHMDNAPLFNVDNLQVLVLDEADRLLDSGFSNEINAIIEALPRGRQTLLFSATQTKSVKALARLSLKTPIYVSADENAEKSTPATLTERYTVCELDKKLDFIWSFLKNHKFNKILIFFNTCKQVRFVFESFCHMRPGIQLLRLHGGLKQHKRMETYRQFAQKKHVAMFATDVAARGLDFSSVEWVIQMDCPCDAVTYIHRVGRTARNEKSGNSLLVLLPSEEEGMLEQLEKKRVQTERIKVNPIHLMSCKSKIQSFCAQFIELKECGRRAFLSYVKDVYKMSNKKIFDVTKLPLQAFAESLGLMAVPKMRFLPKALQLQGINEEKDDEDVSGSESDDESDEETKPATKNFKLAVSDESGDESDEKFLTFKNRPLPISADDDLPLMPTSKRKQKPLTKVQQVKQMLKHTKPNRIVFDEDGNYPSQSKTVESSEPVEDEALDHAEDLKRYKEHQARERQMVKDKKKQKKRKEKEAKKLENAGVQLRMEGDSEEEESEDEPDTPVNKKKQKKNQKRPRDEDDEEDEDENEFQTKKAKLDNKKRNKSFS